MNVARFNFSHGDHKSHKKMLRALRAACKEHPDSHVTIMLDTKGPEIRTGYLENKTPVDLVAQQTLEITTDYTVRPESDHKCALDCREFKQNRLLLCRSASIRQTRRCTFCLFCYLQ